MKMMQSNEIEDYLSSFNISLEQSVYDQIQNVLDNAISDSDVSKRIEKEKDKLKDISYKLNNLLDMHLEGKIDFETFEKKRDFMHH